MKLTYVLYRILNFCKGFKVGYKCDDNDYMLIEHDGKRYAIKIVEIENSNKDFFDDILNLEYYV